MSNPTREEQLRQIIQAEETYRKRRRYTAWAVTIIATILFTIISQKILAILFFFPLCGFWPLIITGAINGKKNKQIRGMLREHSTEMLRTLLERAFPGSDYSPGEFINPQTLIAPFEPNSSNRVSEGSDYIRGHYRGHEFAVCEATLLNDYGEDQTTLCDGIGLAIRTDRTIPAAVARRAVWVRKDRQKSEYVYKDSDKALTDRMLPKEWLLRLYKLNNRNVHACLLPNGFLVLCLSTGGHLFTFSESALSPDDIRASLENDIANLKTLMDTAMSNAELFGSDL